jgi:hypothetical protein
MKVIKGRKYLIAGNFVGEQNQREVKETLEKDLGIEVVGFITSEYTTFIEYYEPQPKKGFRFF